MSKRWITLLLVFCLVLSNIAPAAGAVSFGPSNGAGGSSSGIFDGLIDAAEKLLGISLRDDKSHLQKPDENVLSLVEGKWVATTADGKQIPLTDAQLPQHIQVLRKAAGEYQPMDTVVAFVTLSDAPTAESYKNIQAVPASLTADLKAKQDALLVELNRQFGDIQLVSRYTHLTNSLVISTAFGNLEKIAAIRGVSNVFLNPVFEPCTAKEQVAKPFTMSSSDMTYVSNVWKDLGYTGQGMTVAILDTGLDLDHPSFADAPAGATWDVEKLQQMLDAYDLNLESLSAEAGKPVSAKDLFFSDKVPFTFNYATGNTNVGHNDGLGDHGTHVAGIAAANAVEGTNVSGMAPDAQVFVMKVFSPTGGAGMYTIVDALEDCMKLGVDVVNMSLGSPAGFSESGNEEVDSIFRRVNESDMIVDVAVGNEGSSNAGSKWGYNLSPTQHIDNSTMSSPASYANSMGVASADNKIIAADFFELADGTDIFYQYSVEFLYGYIDFTMDALLGMGYVEYEVIDGLGYEEDFYDENGNSIVEGKVALIKRGELQFGQKALNAQAAGAIATIIWNTDDSDVFYFGMTTAVMGEDGTETIPDIPVCLITLSDGQKMADAQNHVLQVTGEVSFREDILGGQISSYSCWGPTADLRLMPDLTGVGGNVYSTLDGGAYGLMSGTSMACPQVTGVTALVLQYLKETFPNATEAEIRILADSLMMSTAVPIIDRDTGLESSPRQQGAGLVNALGAITAEAYLTVAGSNRPKAELFDNEQGEYTFTFTVHNYSNETRTYAIRSSLLCEDYQVDEDFPGMYFLAEEDRALDNSAVTFSKTSVTVAPGASQDVTVTIRLTEADKEWIHTYFPSGNFIEGFVYLESEDEVTLSLPFMGFYEHWDDAPLFDSGFWYEEGMWEIPGAAITANQYYHLLWTSLGASATDWMLGLNPYMESVQMDEYGNLIGIRPFSLDNCVLSPNGDGVMDQLTELYISLMRNAGQMEIIYTDEADNVLHYELLQKDSKTMFISSYGSTIPFVYSWAYEDLYDFSGLQDGDVVYLTITGNIDYAGAETDVLFDKLPIYIDTSAPAMDTNSIVQTSVDGRNYITFTFEEAHPAAAILMNRSGSQIYTYYGEDEMINNGDGTYTVTLDVTGLGDQLSVALGDFGCNEIYYDLTFDMAPNNPEVDKSQLYAYQVYDELIHSYYGWDYMFGWTHIGREDASVELISSDAYEYYALVAAEYVDGYVFAVDAGYNFLYMVPGLWNRMDICNLGVNVLDMAWDDVSNTMYVTGEVDIKRGGNIYTNGLYTLDLLTGELTEVALYESYYYAPHAMTFVDGQLYCAIANRNGIFQVDLETGKATILQVDGQNVLPKNSRGKNATPAYSQSMTYDKSTGKIYWAYYGEVSDLIVIDPVTWTSTATNFGADREYVGMLTMDEDEDFSIPASTEITRIVISDKEVLLQLGDRYSLSVNLLPWNAPVTEAVVWSSSDESVVSVDQNGNLLAISDGVVTITASYGDLQVTSEVISVGISGNLYAYNFYSGAGYGDWLNIDLASMSAQSLYLSPIDFVAADYNGHDGNIYGYDELGQGYLFNPATGECVALGTSTGVQVLDMAYDYSSGMMYAMSYDGSTNSTIIYYVNMYTGALIESAKAYDAFIALACDLEGQLYAINSGGILFSLKKVRGSGGGGIAPLAAENPNNYHYEQKELMQMPISGMVYAQSMCYDYNNDVILWANPESSQIYWVKPGEYCLALGEPTGTGMIEYTGLYVIPENMPALEYVPVESVSSENMLVLTDCVKVPAVNCYPLNATNQADIVYTSNDESVAKVENGMILGVGLGKTTVTATLTDTAPDGTVVTHQCTFEVMVKQSTDNIYGYLVQDVTRYNSYVFAELSDANPSNYNILDYVYDSSTGIYYTLYSAEYVDGVIYAYGFNDQDWEANFQFITINPETWSITGMKDMGDEFPFVYDMAFDYTSGTLYALAGSTTASALYIVNMASGSLIDCMTFKPFLMSLAIDENGVLYAMAASEEDFDPLEYTSTYSNAKLYTLDVKNQKCELFMDTGIKCNQLASMAYDFDTGYLYWTGFYIGASYVSGLHLIDPSDMTCTNLGTIGGHTQVTGLMIFADEYPEIPTELQNILMISPTLETNIGDSVAADLFLVPGTADAQIHWESFDESVATVDENGVITGVAPGVVTVTASAEVNGRILSASCTVYVYMPEEDFFLVYNRDDRGFSAIDRTDPTNVINLTEGEEGELLRAMEMVNGVIYAYDEAGNFFAVDENFQRQQLGATGIEVEAPYEEIKSYGDYTTYYNYTPNFEVRDMAWDPVTGRMLVLGCHSVIKEYYYHQASNDFTSTPYTEELEYEGGCRVYMADLETGELTELTVILTEGGDEYSGVYSMTVTDTGDVYVYSTYMDFIGLLNMDSGTVKNLSTFQNLGYVGDSDCAPMAMTYDPATNNIYCLFTQNGNAYLLFKFDVTTTMISSIGSIGTEYDDCAGLIINRHSHSYEIWETVEGNCVEPGYTTYRCACGSVRTEQGAYGEHNFRYGYCCHCGQIDMDHLSQAFDSTLFILDYFYELDLEYMIMVTNDVFLQDYDWDATITVDADEYEAMMNEYFVLTEELRQQLRNTQEWNLTYDAENHTYTICYGGGMGGMLAPREYMGYVQEGDVYHVFYGEVNYAYLSDVLPEGVDEWEYAEQLGWPEEIEYEGVIYEAGPDGYFRYLGVEPTGKMYTVELNGNIVRILSCEAFTEEDVPELFDDEIRFELPEDGSVDIDEFGGFQDGATVKVEQKQEGEIFESAASSMEQIAESFQVFEFNAYKNGAAVQPDGSLTVTFAIPAGYSTNVVLYYMDANGRLEQLQAVVDADERTITVELTHFSTYILADLDTAPDALIGDLNGDGRITVRDARLLLQFLADLVEIDESLADFNGDGRVTARDVRAILQYIANLD